MYVLSKPSFEVKRVVYENRTQNKYIIFQCAASIAIVLFNNIVQSHLGRLPAVAMYQLFDDLAYSIRSIQ